MAVVEEKLQKEELKSVELSSALQKSKDEKKMLEEKARLLEQRVRELELESRDKDLERESLKSELKDLQAGSTSQSSEGDLFYFVSKKAAF